MPFLAARASLNAPWDIHPSQWPEEVRAQAAMLVEQMLGYLAWQAVALGPRAPGVGRREEGSGFSLRDACHV